MRIWNWAKRLLGIRNAFEFVTLDQAQQAGSSVGKVGQGLDSNVVMAPVQWLMRTFTQAEPIVQRKTAPRRWADVDEHPAERLLVDPNPYYDGDAMTKAILLSYFLDGNAYMLKVRNTLRGVEQIWYVPHWMLEPKWPRDGSVFISHYEYTPASGVMEEVDPADVVHLRFGLDPRNPRKGLSPIKTALREVLTDEEASGFSAFILSNMGVPGGVISPADASVMPSQEDVDAMKEHMATGFTGQNRGKWLVMGAPSKVEQFGFDPHRLNIGPLRDISEERICAILGLPAAVVGFGAGLQQTKVGATMRELVRLARVNCVEPTQNSIARQLSRQLLPDFEPRPEGFRISYDNSGVSMFQEDETEVAKRAAQLYKNDVVDRDEARAMIGLDADPGNNGRVQPKSNQPPPPENRVQDAIAAELNGGTP